MSNSEKEIREYIESKEVILTHMKLKIHDSDNYEDYLNLVVYGKLNQEDKKHIQNIVYEYTDCRVKVNVFEIKKEVYDTLKRVRSLSESSISIINRCEFDCDEKVANNIDLMISELIKLKESGCDLYEK